MVWDGDFESGQYSFVLARSQPIGRLRDDRDAPKSVTASPQDRRRARRSPLVLEAQLIVDAGPVAEPICVTDVSRTGAFLEGGHGLCVGDELALLLDVCGDTHLHLAARVVRQVSPEDAVRAGSLFGVGVEFVDVPATTLAELDRTLASSACR